MSSIDIASLGRTGLIGGDDAPYFNDLNKLMTGSGQLNLNSRSPIRQIQCNAGWGVDSLTIAYRGADDSSITQTHGKGGGNPNVVDLSDSEIITSCFGRAGYLNYYKTRLVNCIGFTIFDQQRCTTRTVGPFGNGDGSNNGEPFYTGSVIGFAGHANQDAGQLGLRGLYVIERMGGSQGLVPVQVPDALRMGTFNTGEVRDWQNLVPDTRKTIKLEPAHASGPPPIIVCGLSQMDVNGSFNIRCRSLVESTSRDAFTANIQTWADSQLYSGAINWLDVPLSRGVQGGTIPQQWTVRDATTEPFVLGNIRFDRPYMKPPTVLLWLTGIDMDRARNWRLKTIATNVTANGFTASVQTWSDSKLYGSGVSWIAIPDGAQDMVIGKYSGNTSSQSGQVSFGRKLSAVPRVLVALSGVDFEKGVNMRVKTSPENITQEGFKWNLNTWSNSTMHWAECTYIAIVD